MIPIRDRKHRRNRNRKFAVGAENGAGTFTYCSKEDFVNAEVHEAISCRNDVNNGIDCADFVKVNFIDGLAVHGSLCFGNNAEDAKRQITNAEIFETVQNLRYIVEVAVTVFVTVLVIVRMLVVMMIFMLVLVVMILFMFMKMPMLIPVPDHITRFVVPRIKIDRSRYIGMRRVGQSNRKTLCPDRAPAMPDAHSKNNFFPMFNTLISIQWILQLLV